jgi:hypothetical protein
MTVKTAIYNGIISQSNVHGHVTLGVRRKRILGYFREVGRLLHPPVVIGVLLSQRAFRRPAKWL